jgi:Na+/proline symporter
MAACCVSLAHLTTASPSTVDIYKRSLMPGKDDNHYVKTSRWLTIGWAAFAIGFASLVNLAENLIQYVNIVGSLFYGTILGIFLSAFYIKYLKGTAVFIAAVAGELVILGLYFFTDVAFLLYNIIGCVAVVVFAFIVQYLQNKRRPTS